ESFPLLFAGLWTTATTKLAEQGATVAPGAGMPSREGGRVDYQRALDGLLQAGHEGGDIDVVDGSLNPLTAALDHGQSAGLDRFAPVARLEGQVGVLSNRCQAMCCLDPARHPAQSRPFGPFGAPSPLDIRQVVST
ncbi:MAG: hypothetical protein K8J08_17125, partial [Thermoanaerobaculia bacterium]|nr:hypothetical protein [Thermoanaerobaculia bacterium]